MKCLGIIISLTALLSLCPNKTSANPICACARPEPPLSFIPPWIDDPCPVEFRNPNLRGFMHHIGVLVSEMGPLSLNLNHVERILDQTAVKLNEQGSFTISDELTSNLANNRPQLDIVDNTEESFARELASSLKYHMPYVYRLMFLNEKGSSKLGRSYFSVLNFELRLLLCYVGGVYAEVTSNDASAILTPPTVGWESDVWNDAARDDRLKCMGREQAVIKSLKEVVQTARSALASFPQ